MLKQNTYPLFETLQNDGVPSWLGEQLPNPVCNCTGDLGAPRLVIYDVTVLTWVPAWFALKEMFVRRC